MIGLWKRVLLDNIADWRLPADGEWSFVVSNNYQPHCSNISVMWFHNGGAFPSVVVKFGENPVPLKAEFENMRRAHESAPAVVPNPLHFGLQGRLWGLWAEGVPGSVLTGYDPKLLDSLVETVTSLHLGLRRKTLDQDRYRRMVQEPLQAVSQFGPSSAVQKGCSQIGAAISPQWLNALPVIPQHGDLYSGNILSHRDRLYVVDWESFGVIDLPFYDLLIALYSLLRDTGETPASWHPALTNRIPSLVQRYAQRLDLTASDVSLMLPLALANWFYLHLNDGRKAFTETMYRTIEQYFEAPELWKLAFWR
jgi:Phosphotransferase enzyme family